MDLELLEEKGDLENELENELKFQTTELESFAKNSTSDNYKNSSLFKLQICQENGVSTSPQHM